MAQLVALMSGVVLGRVAEVLGSNLARVSFYVKLANCEIRKVENRIL